VETGHASAVLCHIANAMIRLFPETGPGHVAKWDAKAEQQEFRYQQLRFNGPLNLAGCRNTR